MKKKSSIAKPMYPEHDKLEKLDGASQACGEFLTWLQHQGYELALVHEHDAECYANSTPGRHSGRICGFRSGELAAAPINLRKLLGAFFNIDESKLEKEKVAMIASLRKREADW